MRIFGTEFQKHISLNSSNKNAISICLLQVVPCLLSKFNTFYSFLMFFFLQKTWFYDKYKLESKIGKRALVLATRCLFVFL